MHFINKYARILTSGGQMAPTQTPRNSGNNNSNKQRGSLSASDRQFMIKAAQSDQDEIMTS
jgi:hypothetical protein